MAKVKPDLLEELDEAEANAIALAAFLKADLLLMDERAGTCVALAKGIRVTGTLGVLDLAADRGAAQFCPSYSEARTDKLLEANKNTQSARKKSSGAAAFLTVHAPQK